MIWATFVYPDLMEPENDTETVVSDSLLGQDPDTVELVGHDPFGAPLYAHQIPPEGQE